MSRFDDNLLALPATRTRFDIEARASGGWWAMSRASNLMPVTAQSGNRPPVAAQRLFAADLSEALNRHLHHDGRWVVLFTHPHRHLIIHEGGTEYGRWVLLWMDEDGDIQIPIENDEPFNLALVAGLDHWMDAAEQAWQTWNHHMRTVLAPIAGQTFKRAQGQQPAH